MKPTIGRLVQYRLSDGDVERLGYDKYYSGETVVLLVTAVNGDSETPESINGHLFLDGSSGSVWIESVYQGSNLGEWDWPPRT
jgi:hypothetical protein